ncbi:MAG TPA: hypothetical protein V6D22_13845 [Candidatus Obscuribacterales bacterium]
MTDTRFRWDAASELEAAFELKSRAIVKPAATRQDGLRCRIKACRHHIKEGEAIYLPTANPGKDNKTAAHVECVNRFCAEQEAKGSAAARAERDRELKAKQVLALPTTHSLASSSLKHAVEGDGNSSYYRGFHAGILLAFEKRLVPAPQNTDNEWLRGFYEGTSFGAEHRQ